MDSLPVYYGNPVSEHAENNLNLTCIGHMLAISPYKQLNTLSTYHYLDLMGEGCVFGLPEGEQDVRASHQSSEKYVRTRNKFDEGATFAKLASLVSKGASVRTTLLSEEFTYEDYLKLHGNRLNLLFAIRPDGKVVPLGRDENLKPVVSWEIISIIQPEPAPDSGSGA